MVVDPLGPDLHSGNFDHIAYMEWCVNHVMREDGVRGTFDDPDFGLTLWARDEHDEFLLNEAGERFPVLTAKGRIFATEDNPMLFALVYCRNLISDDSGHVSFADLHLELCRYVQAWKKAIEPRESRTAFVAPREAGKSSWVFKILPLWAAAHRHIRFVAAFSSSATQAQKHLSGFKRQLDTNVKIREDYPDLCKPAKRPSGGNVSDTQEMYHSTSGFTFTAAGLDSEILGLVDPNNVRPDLIILDDIEPDESNYSQYQMKKRRTTILDTVLPMNERAHVALIGTVTMPQSIVHQLVETVTTDKEVPQWIKDEKFNVRYLEPIVNEEDGERRSIWPFKWPLVYLEEIEHTRSYKKNFKNQPVSEDGDYWTEQDFQYGDVPHPTHVVLQIDPAVTSKQTSDYYGVAVVAFDREARKCAVWYCRQFKVSPKVMRKKALEICELFPQIGRIRVEANQGHETWHSVFHDMPVKVILHSESIPKKVRASHTLNHYQRGRVFHTKKFPELEDQMLAFPHVLNDDMVDAVGAGTSYFLKPMKKAGGNSIPYGGRS
jgi:phage terminase large subunit-like protein